MTEAIKRPTVKRRLVAILRGIRPARRRRPSAR